MADEAPDTDVFAALAANHLIWIPECGVGFYPIDLASLPYDAAYFSRYEGYAATPMGRALNTARNALVARHWHGPVVDVGVGCGSFVQSRPQTWGYDINPVAVSWLKARRRWQDPYQGGVMAMTLWDVLEHIPDFATLLENVEERVFVSMPVYIDCEDVLSSRHFRPNEHCWYFTTKGFTTLMRDLGWKLLEMNREETRLGRNGIGSFAFARV